MLVTRETVLRYRVGAQQLHRAAGADAAILDLGVQDTGPDGAAWALRIRGCTPDPSDLFTAWTLRGAPHVYRRTEAAGVAAATAPLSSADAAKRIFDAARPLKAAGIDPVDALAAIAHEMRDIVRSPMVKGEMSSRLTARMPDPYLRHCTPCDAVHLYEQPFRLSALQAGLELQPGTSPPVLQRIPGWKGPAARVPHHLDPVRACLHLLGPATPKLVAGYLDSPVAVVKEHWPADVTEVDVDGEARSILDADAEALADPPSPDGSVRLLGPFDLFLQARDRELVVPDEARRKDLWRTLGRPGAVLSGHEVVGTWRPRASGSRLRVLVDRWADVDDDAVLAQAELLAGHRGLGFAGLADS